MTVYKSVPGVVQTSLAGQYLLVAAKEVRKNGSDILEINETSAFLWRKLQSGSTVEELFSSVLAEYDVDDMEETRTAVEGFVQEMLKMRYVKGAECL